MSMYISKYAVCPFYHRHDNNRICCEGTNDTNTINIVFEDSKRQKEYGITHCNDMNGCKKCLIYQTLDRKYSKS